MQGLGALVMIAMCFGPAAGLLFKDWLGSCDIPRVSCLVSLSRTRYNFVSTMLVAAFVFPHGGAYGDSNLVSGGSVSFDPNLPSESFVMQNNLGTYVVPLYEDESVDHVALRSGRSSYAVRRRLTCGWVIVYVYNGSDGLAVSAVEASEAGALDVGGGLGIFPGLAPHPLTQAVPDNADFSFSLRYHASRTNVIQFPVILRHLAASGHLAGKTSIAVHGYGGRVWSIYPYRNGPRLCLGHGWLEFVAANGIVDNEKVVFVLLNETILHPNLLLPTHVHFNFAPVHRIRCGAL